MPRLFPFMQLPDFLDKALNAEILNYAIENQALFMPSAVYNQGRGINSKIRVSSTFRDLGPYKLVLEEKLSQLIPGMVEILKIPSFKTDSIDLQLAAHGDGAFFKTHIDTAVHENTATPRLISIIYYLHSIPQQFSGGNLLIHPMPFGTGNDKPVEIVPANNSLVAFPSFSPHEVLPVIAPNVPFKDWRFAVNCWIHKG